jgi:hypothetical protein
MSRTWISGRYPIETAPRNDSGSRAAPGSSSPGGGVDAARKEHHRRVGDGEAAAAGARLDEAGLHLVGLEERGADEALDAAARLGHRAVAGEPRLAAGDCERAGADAVVAELDDERHRDRAAGEDQSGRAFEELVDRGVDVVD